MATESVRAISTEDVNFGLFVERKEGRETSTYL